MKTITKKFIVFNGKDHKTASYQKMKHQLMDEDLMVIEMIAFRSKQHIL